MTVNGKMHTNAFLFDDQNRLYTFMNRLNSCAIRFSKASIRLALQRKCLLINGLDIGLKKVASI